MKKSIYQLLEPGSTERPGGRAVDVTLLVLIFFTIVAILAATISEDIKEIATWFIIAAVLIFTVEYGLRLWSCTEKFPSRWAFARSPLGLIDALAIVPFYALILLSSVFGEAGLDLLAQLFLLLLIFKIARYSTALQTLGRVVHRSQAELFAILIVELTVLVLSSTAMYFIEGDAQPEHFGTIPRAMWWGVVTLSTVGYGDTAPVTGLGRFFAGVVAMFGVAMFALPAGVLGASFAQEIRKTRQ